MERIKGFSIELSLDSLKVDSGLTDLKASMRQMNSEMRNNMSAFDRSEKSLKKYETQLGGLNKKLELQKIVVSDAEKHYNKMVEAHGEGSSQAQKAAAAYNNESAQLNNLERHISNVTKEMQEFSRQQDIQSSGWYKTGDALQNFGGKLGGVSQKARDVGSTLTRRITLPVAGITTAIGGMVAAFGWGRLTSVDNAQAQLKGLGYETEDVERISGQLTEALEGGMLTMGEATSAAATAMASGVKEGEELQRYIQILDGTVAGSTGTFEEMEQIFGRIVDQGSMTRNEFDMIAQRMPGFSKAVQEGMNVSSDEMYEMLRNGEITTDQFLDIMEDFSGEMAKEYAKTWDGMKQNTKAYIGILGQNLLGGVFERSKESLADFIEILSSNQAQKWAEETGKTLGNAFSSLVDKIKLTINWYKDLTDGQKKFILGIGGFIVALGPLLTGLGMLGGFIAKISSGLGVFFKFLAPILTPLKGVGTAAASTGKSVGLLSKALTFMTGPVGIAIGVITALTTGFTVAYKKSETFRNFIDKLGEKIKEVFFGIVDWIRPGFDAVLSFFGDLKTKISEFANQEGPSLIEAFQNIWNFVSPILGWLADKVKWAFDTVIKPVINLAMQAVQMVIKMIWGNIKGIIAGALDVIMGAVKIFSGLFTGDWSKMWEGVQQLTTGAIKVVWNWIQLQFIGRILKGVAGLAKGFWGHIKNMWAWVKETFKNSITSVYGSVKNSFVGRIIQAIINFVKNFKLNISNMWTAVKATFSKWIGNIRTSIANSFVGHMLKSVRNLKTKFIGVAKDMWGGVKKQFNNIVEGAKGLPKRIGDGILSAKKKATDGMKDVGNGLIEWAGKPYNRVIGGVNWIIGKLTGTEGTIKGWPWKDNKYAKGTGTGGHPGGLAMVNDGRGHLSGRELISFPDGTTGMFKGKDVVANLPKGTHVFSAPDTRSLLSGMPQYNRGTSSTQGFLDKGTDMTGGKARKRTWSEKVWDYVKKPSKLLDIALDKAGAKLPKNTAMFKDMLKGGFGKIKDAAIDKVKNLFSENEHNNPNLMVGGKPSFGFPITSHFGMRTHPVYGTKKLHTGTDFGAPAGTPIPSQTGGTVSFAGWGGGYGNLVKVKSGIWEMYYAHMSKILASVGQKVTRGTKLGLVGSTGTSTAAHLHYEVRKNGKPLDPMKVSPAGAVGSGVQRWAGTATKALKMTGSYSASNLQKLLYQMKTESNGNPRAINNWDINAKRGTPSKGLMQVIDPTFAAYKMPGYNNIWNPLDNILASIRYALSRYGSLSRAYRGVGYKQGTNYVPENQWAFLHKGEAVIPEKYNQQPKKTDAMKLLALVAKKIGADGGKRTRTNHDTNNVNSEEISLLKQQVQLLTELVVSSRNIEKKPVLSEGDIKRSYDKLDSKQSRNHDIFTGKPGGAY